MYVDVRVGRGRRRSWTEVLLIFSAGRCIDMSGRAGPELALHHHQGQRRRKRSARTGYWSEFNVGKPLRVCLLLFVHNCWDIWTWEGLSVILSSVSQTLTFLHDTICVSLKTETFWHSVIRWCKVLNVKLFVAAYSWSYNVLSMQLSRDYFFFFLNAIFHPCLV